MSDALPVRSEPPFIRGARSLYSVPAAGGAERENPETVEDWTTARGSLAACRIVDLPKIHDPRGNLSFIESNVHVPFDIERVYYLYDVPGGSERGGHAHKELKQLIIAMSGSFDVLLDDGRNRKRVHLARSSYGLYVCPLIWRELDNFSSGSVCMVIASNKYDEADYYREYSDFMRARWAA